jgi:hypothetical protein
VGINLWTAHGSWFWLLVYPDRHGGATGAAPTEAEAVREARAAFERAGGRAGIFREGDRNGGTSQAFVNVFTVKIGRAGS